MRDSRRYERVGVSIPATLRQSGRLIPATVLNVSQDGILIKADTSDVTSGAPVEATFNLNNTKDLSVVCRVRHCERYEDSALLGLQFKTFLSEDCSEIRNFISKKI